MASRPDVYQDRYLEHQAVKAQTIAAELDALPLGIHDRAALFNVLRARRSRRVFGEAELTREELEQVYEAIRLAPSSCNRQAILVKPITDDVEKEWLGRLLVGGARWLATAKVVLLLFADMLAYKSPAEKDFMPYLDTGFVGQNIYLAATALNIGVCFVNPNIRPQDRQEFFDLFNPRSHLFCGAVALGKVTGKGVGRHKRRLEELFYQ